MMKRLKKVTIYTLSAIILLLSLVFCSGGKFVNPEPEENPVILNADAQTKLIHIKHLNYIGPESSSEGIVDGVYIDGGWLKITHLDKSRISIEVAENTTVHNRTYMLYLYGHRGAVTHEALSIIQHGRKE